MLLRKEYDEGIWRSGPGPLLSLSQTWGMSLTVQWAWTPGFMTGCMEVLVGTAKTEELWPPSLSRSSSINFTEETFIWSWTSPLKSPSFLSFPQNQLLPIFYSALQNVVPSALWRRWNLAKTQTSKWKDPQVRLSAWWFDRDDRSGPLAAWIGRVTRIFWVPAKCARKYSQ